MNSGRWRETLLLLVLGVLWGIPFALTKVSLTDIPPLSLVAARVSLAAVALWLIVRLRHGSTYGWRCLTPALLVQGLAACALPYALITIGQKSVPSGLAAILNSTTPLFVCLIGAVWFGHKTFSAARLFGLILGLGGVICTVGADYLLGFGNSVLGQAAIVAATVSSAISAIYGRRFAVLPSEVTAAGALGAAAAILIPLSFAFESPLRISPSLPSLLALATNGLAATALGFVIYFRLIRTLGSLGAASASYLKPSFGVLIGCTLMGEALTWPLVLGMAAILAGVAIINGPPRSPTAASAPIALAKAP
jgi:drug/metabolite transporter (DMT)-like permease